MADGKLPAALDCCLKGQLWDYGLELLGQHEQQASHGHWGEAAGKQTVSGSAVNGNSGGSCRGSSSASNGTASSGGGGGGGSTSSLCSSYVQQCASALHRLNQKDAMMRFVGMLTAARQRTFLINRGYISELVEQIAASNTAEAASVCEAAGDLLQAARLYERDSQRFAAARLLLRYTRLLLLWPESVSNGDRPSNCWPAIASGSADACSAAPCAAAGRAGASDQQAKVAGQQADWQNSSSTQQLARQLLSQVGQLLSTAGDEGSAAAQDCALEASVLSGLAAGFSSQRQVVAWQEAFEGMRGDRDGVGASVHACMHAWEDARYGGDGGLGEEPGSRCGQQQ